MKHLKSSSLDLREIFSRDITVRYIAEPLASFDGTVEVATVRQFLLERHYDIVGVRQAGFLMGYARKEAFERDHDNSSSGLNGNKLIDYATPIPTELLIKDSEPLIQVILRMRTAPTLFVESLGQINGIVTLGDIQKAPVRMWLFGLISLTEMQLLRVIRITYSHNNWQQYLSETRLKLAQEMLEQRQAQNAEIDLADCLQFCDKRDIFLKSERLHPILHPHSKNKGERLLRDLETLRNNLAHAQDIVTGQWPQMAGLAEQTEQLLMRLETFF